MKADENSAGDYVPSSRPQMQQPVNETKTEVVREPEQKEVVSTEEEDELYLLGDIKETKE
jgi:hypothetical protein